MSRNVMSCYVMLCHVVSGRFVGCPQQCSSRLQKWFRRLLKAKNGFAMGQEGDPTNARLPNDQKWLGRPLMARNNDLGGSTNNTKMGKGPHKRFKPLENEHLYERIFWVLLNLDFLYLPAMFAWQLPNCQNWSAKL